MRVLTSILAISMALLLSGCEKEVKTWTITYKVVNFEATPATFRVEFTNEQGNTEVRGPFETNWWVSRDVLEVETGTDLQFTFELVNGRGDFELFIEANGSSIATRSERTPNGPVVLDVTVNEPPQL